MPAMGMPKKSTTATKPTMPPPTSLISVSFKATELNVVPGNPSQPRKQMHHGLLCTKKRRHRAKSSEKLRKFRGGTKRLLDVADLHILVDSQDRVADGGTGCRRGLRAITANSLPSPQRTS